MGIMSETILKSVNYYIYIYQNALIVIGVIGSIWAIVSNFKKYSYRREFAIFVKTTILMFLSSLILEGIGIASITAIEEKIFHDISAMMIIGFFILFVVEKLFFYRIDNKGYHIEQDFIGYLIYLVYFLMVIAMGYGLKYLLFALSWQIVLISLRFNMNTKKVEVKKKDRLYPSRKEQLKTVEKIINESEYKNFAIAISGKWGTGKSLFLETLMARTEENSNYCIYIKPMITDTRETLISEFQKRLSNIMIKNGIYCGRYSALESYFKEVLGLLTVSGKASIVSLIKGVEESKSYRDFKEEVQRDIDALLSESNKLVVVIDDFDRIDEKKQLDVLTFIKEVIDFRGCIVIFAFDYNNITDTKFITAEYLEKFIATKINLINVSFDELINYHRDEGLSVDNIKSKYVKDILTNIYDNSIDYFNEQYEYFVQAINKNHEVYLINDDYETQLVEFKIRLRDSIDNSVRVIHFLKEILTSLITIEATNNQDKSIENFFLAEEVAKLVFTVNFIKVFQRKIYDEKIEVQGMKTYLESNTSKFKSIDEAYVRILLSQVLICNDDNKDMNAKKRCVSLATKFMKI